MTAIHDELSHIIKNLAAQAFQEHRPWVYGHIATYDPSNNTARVVIPSMRDDQTGAPMLSPWLPMSSGQVGSQSGIQVVPFGGATSENPTQGELCLVALNERGTGVSAIVATFYTGAQQPPHTELVGQGQQGLLPGELLIRQNSGAFTRFHADGRIESQAAADKPITLTTTGQGRVTVVSALEVDITAPTVKVTGQLQVTGEVTANFGSGDPVTLSQHEHKGGNGGQGRTSPPVAGT